MKPYSGILITLEGIDGSGKSTLAKRLSEHFEGMGYRVLKTREPGGTAFAEHCRQLLLDSAATMKISERTELFLFLAARLSHIEEAILPALKEGQVVICERFNDSTIAYQGCARHVGMDYVEKLCTLAIPDVTVDCTLLLDADPEILLSRVEVARDRFEKEKLQFYREVRNGYLHLADKYRERIVIIDALLGIDDLFAAAIKAIGPHLLLKAK